MARQRTIALVAAPLLVALVALVVAGGVYSWPGPPIRVRITHTSGTTPRPITVAVDYCRARGGRASPTCETVPVPFAVEGEGLVADIPRSIRVGYREHVLARIPVDGVGVMLAEGTPTGSDAGVATVAFSLGDTPDWALVAVAGARELHVDVDDVPLVTTTLAPRDLVVVMPIPPEEDPDTGEPRPPRTDEEMEAELEAQLQVTQIRTEDGEFPRVRLCRGGHATFAFDIRPWPADQRRIEAVVVEGDLRRQIEEHYRERFRPAHDLPLIVTRDEWARLLERDATRRGYRGGTPTLTIARGDHTVTLWTATGEGWDEPEFHEGVVLVGVLDPRSRSAAVGAVLVEVTRYRCTEHPQVEPR